MRKSRFDPQDLNRKTPDSKPDDWTMPEFVTCKLLALFYEVFATLKDSGIEKFVSKGQCEDWEKKIIELHKMWTKHQENNS